MKRGIFISVAFFLLVQAESLIGQNLIRTTSVAGVCYAGEGINKFYIPPPRKFLERDKSKGANITVYYSGFSSAPRAAFQYAVSILSALLPDDARFTIRATWGPLSENNILGSTSITSYSGGAYIDALNPMVYYPVALAEKILGEKLNTDEEGDLLMTINSKVTWYYGIDGNTPISSYDLVTVVLHELIHGIGFVDSFSSANSLGSYGLNSIPLIYDSFIEDKDGFFLTDKTKYSNNSAELNTQLVGGPIYFSGPLLETFNLGQRARIYAPSSWDEGSSISHLNETTYNSSKNALLTPFLDKGEAIHSPGDLIMSILGDLGWINTRISHEPLNDTETNLSQVTFKASIISDTTFKRDLTGIVYSFNNSTVKDTLFMIPPVTGDTFRINLSIPSYNTLVKYYFFATDRFERNYRLPTLGVSLPYTFFIGKDTVKPVIRHTPVKYIFDKTTRIKLYANALDNIGIDTVYVEYRKNTGSSKFSGLINDSLDYYSGFIDIKSLAPAPGDSIRYRIIAKDKALTSNSKFLPSSGFYAIKIESSFGVVAGYSTDFTSASPEFVNDGFTITKPSQFTSAGLHTNHPYESPDKDDAAIEYTSALRYPIKVDDSGIVISFLEVVLVEPGETGSVYGSDDFYDYVVVEASKDFGATWFPMADGYDSRTSSTFLNSYNSAMSGNNSTFTGTQDMYIRRTIDRRTFDKYNKGDTLMIRFRLYSDPYAHGWGWAVDDLSIKSVASDINDVTEAAVEAYPNPGTGILKVDWGEAAAGQILYNVISISGIPVTSGKIQAGQEGSIDISSQPPGIYIVTLRSGHLFRSIRYVKLR